MAEHPQATADEELIQALEAIVGKEHVVSGADALPGGVDGVEPRATVFPADAGEIGAVLAYANKKRLAVLPIGGGTQLGLGHPPERADIALSLSRLDKIVAHEPADMTVTVQAGMSIAALQAHLAQYGQCLPYDPPLPGRATVGGIIATREAGPLRQVFRGVADRLLGIHVVTTDGKLVKAGGRVVKNVTGYEMGRLYAGSMGTLAVIVEATFKVQPRFEVAEGLIVALPDLSAAGRTIRALLDSDAEPIMLELVGPVDTKTAASNGPLAEQLEAFSRGPSDLGSQRASGPGALLVAGYAGTREEVDWQLGEAERIVTRVFDGKPVPMERIDWEAAHQAVLKAHREDAEAVASVAANEPSPPRAPAQEQGPESHDRLGYVTCRAHVRASELSGFLSAALSLVGDDGGVRYASHAGVGIVRLHLLGSTRGDATDTGGTDGTSDTGSEERLVALIGSLREQSARAGGFLVVEHAPAEVKRRVSVFGPPRQDFFLHKAIKERMDPNRILNPGRFVGNL